MGQTVMRQVPYKISVIIKFEKTSEISTINKKRDMGHPKINRAHNYTQKGHQTAFNNEHTPILFGDHCTKMYVP